jgi:hypothetical protein
MFGALWTYWGGDVALVWCAAGLASTAAASAWLIRRQVVATSA